MTDTPNIDGALFSGVDEAALLTPPHKTRVIEGVKFTNGVANTDPAKTSAA